MPQPDGDLATQRQAVDAFLAASRAGDFEALLAVLDPDVVFRAHGGRELQQELTGAADVARSFAASGPRFATRCHRAAVNGQAGLLLKTGQGLLGAIGFTVSGGLITTVDLTLDPEKLEGLGNADDAGLLSYVRGREGSVAERIIGEALSWPGVHRANGDFGSVVLRLDGRELGHLHGDAVADVPLSPEHDSGWVTVPLETDEGVERALALLRGNYQRGQVEKRSV